MIYTIFIKVTFTSRGGKMVWYAHQQEHREFPEYIEAPEHLGKIMLPLRPIPEGFPNIIELVGVETDSSMRDFLRLLNENEKGDKWQNTGIPRHVIQRCINGEDTHCYRTSSLESMLLHAEGALRYAY